MALFDMRANRTWLQHDVYPPQKGVRGVNQPRRDIRVLRASISVNDNLYLFMINIVLRKYRCPTISLDVSWRSLKLHLAANVAAFYAWTKSNLRWMAGRLQTSADFQTARSILALTLPA
jgi:hypothetical protein